MEKKILVVDDEKTIRDVLVEAFQEAGYTVQRLERWRVDEYDLKGKDRCLMTTLMYWPDVRKTS